MKRTAVSSTTTYTSWRNMHQRCSNPKHEHYSYYGARGIKVCERWKTFEAFFADMGTRPDGKTLDRVDGNGDYEPSNCQWATKMQQTQNRSCARVVHLASGEQMSAKAFADAHSIQYETLLYRLKRGLPLLVRCPQGRPRKQE